MLLRLEQGTEAIKTRMDMNVFGAKFNNHIYHTYFKSLSSLTWTLDYTRRSTLGARLLTPPVAAQRQRSRAASPC
jgi:hypothetical protein